MVDALAPREIEALRRVEPTYPAIGATAGGDLPQGYVHIDRSRRLYGVDFGVAAEHLMAWRVQESAGLQVVASSASVAEGSVVVMRLGLGPIAIRLPCRVVHVVDHERRVGFAYGTLPGHAETGEELFLLESDTDGRVTFTVRAFSRPASRLARAGGPLTRWAQLMMTERYLNAFATLG